MSVLTFDSPTDAEDDFSDVPANFRKGAKFTWHQYRRHRAVLGLLRGLKGNVLDYGCGYGDQSYAVSKTHEVCGTDLDPRRVAFANREYAPIEFKVCTPKGAPYPDESFDNVMSIVVLNFIADAPPYIQEIRRLLRPGGHLIIACQNCFRVQSALRRLSGRGPLPPSPTRRSRREVRDLLESQGFSVRAESHFYDPPFDSWKNAGDFLIGSIEQVLSLFAVREAAGYFLMLAQKSAR